MAVLLKDDIGCRFASGWSGTSRATIYKLMTKRTEGLP